MALIQTFSKICQQGFDDPLLFLQQNNLVTCYQCISTILGSKRHLDDINCLECETQKKASTIFLVVFFTYSVTFSMFPIYLLQMNFYSF